MMAGNLQIIVLLLIPLSIGCTTVTQQPADLETAEANGKLEIIKQIKKVNDDGSYTIGYEADDGTFKIESRDVLGNIKGTYGFIDDDGEIKRVSYSSSNSSDVVTSTEEPLSVVQRIPAKLNRTTPTTRKPTLSSTSTSSTIQTVTRRRNPLTTSSTEKYAQFIKEALIASKSTTDKPSASLLFETSTPARLLAQSKPLVRSTLAPQSLAQKAEEGQLLRPEVTLKSTDMPLYRRLPIKTTLIDDNIKPVSEEGAEVRGNLLRRQLPQIQEKNPNFDARQHVLNIQQGAGDDTVDVYTASVTTGSPRPLFTTIRSRVSPTTAAPVIHRPTPFIRYSPAYQRPTLRTSTTTTEYNQESSSTESAVTATPVPVVQIPANNENPQRQQFVELQHPFHRGAILVPVSHLQGRRVPPQQQQQQQQHHQQQLHQQQQQQPDEQEYQQVVITNDPRIPQDDQIYVRRVPKFRPIPVHVDDNGYVREYPQHIQQPQAATPYPVPARPQYISQADIINEVDQIKPPVSTRDFQKLLEQLLQRQARLERINALTRNPDYYRPRPTYQDVGPVQFIPRRENPQPVLMRPQDDYNQYSSVTYAPAPANYPTKRQARLQPNDEEYLPPPVREMLLLRMLQLAINPHLPLEVEDNVQSATTTSPRKDQVRNVEILGEEDEHKRPSRTKRYKEIEFDYFD